MDMSGFPGEWTPASVRIGRDDGSGLPLADGLGSPMSPGAGRSSISADGTGASVSDGTGSRPRPGGLAGFTGTGDMTISPGLRSVIGVTRVW